MKDPAQTQKPTAKMSTKRIQQRRFNAAAPVTHQVSYRFFNGRTRLILYIMKTISTLVTALSR